MVVLAVWLALRSSVLRARLLVGVGFAIATSFLFSCVQLLARAVNEEKAELEQQKQALQP